MYCRRLALVFAFSLCGVVTCAQQPSHQSKGLPARSKPTDYKSHVEVAGVTYAASLVPADEVKHIFSFDISKSYVVFEVAVYPLAGAGMNISPDGFLVRSSGNGDPARRADAVTVASVIQQKNLPKQPSRINPPVTVSTEVGYETGRDPYTGQRVHGTYTASQVEVGRDNRPPPMPAPGGYPQDRELLEFQLWDKSLPEGSITRPAAGYLYFSSSLLKKKAGGIYELEYASSEPEPQLNGSTSSTPKILLRVPSKKTN